MTATLYCGVAGGCSGDDLKTVSDVIEPNASATFIPNAPGGASTPFSLSTQFVGSGVVSGSETLAGMGMLGNTFFNWTSPTMGRIDGGGEGQYQMIGENELSDMLFFPDAKVGVDGRSTRYFVQAAETDAEIDVLYRMHTLGDNPRSVTIEATHAIGANRSIELRPDTGDLECPCRGSAVVTSRDPNDLLAGVAVETESGRGLDRGEPSARTLGVVRALGRSSSDTQRRLTAPVFKSGWYGQTSELVVQNVTLAHPATISGEFVPSVGTPGLNCSNRIPFVLQVDPGESYVVSASGEGSILGLPTSCLGSIALDASTSIGVVVHEHGDDGVSSYRGEPKPTVTFPDDNRFRMTLPLVKEHWADVQSGIALYNFGSQAAEVNLTYSVAATMCDAGDPDCCDPKELFCCDPADPLGCQDTTVAITKTVPARGSATVWAPWRDQEQYGRGAAGLYQTLSSVEIQSSQPVTAMVQESAFPGAPASNDQSNYQGFHVLPTGSFAINSNNFYVSPVGNLFADLSGGVTDLEFSPVFDFNLRSAFPRARVLSDLSNYDVVGWVEAAMNVGFDLSFTAEGSGFAGWANTALSIPLGGPLTSATFGASASLASEGSWDIEVAPRFGRSLTLGVDHECADGETGCRAPADLGLWGLATPIDDPTHEMFKIKQAGKSLDFTISPRIGLEFGRSFFSDTISATGGFRMNFDIRSHLESGNCYNEIELEPELFLYLQIFSLGQKQNYKFCEHFPANSICQDAVHIEFECPGGM